jgi:protein transport protein SEC24
VDRLQRPELTHGVVEYIAPQEYMVRPPQPVVIVFLIDVSVGAVQSGMVAVAAKAILDSLDRIPNTDDRTKVGFITFDSSMHYYNLAASSTEPRMVIVADLEQPFVPLPYDLLVSLTESRPAIEVFLQKLPSLFGNNQQTLSAFGKALRSAEKLIGSIGGKIVCLQHSLPNHDEGALKTREDPKLLGTPKETILLSPATVFYKNFAVDCSPNQISLDVFLFNGQYNDVATLGGIAKFTGGGLYFYQGFNASRAEDAIKFGSELSHLLTRPLGLEAVLRIRASKGIKMTTFHGNFFLRSTDLLSLPNVSPDNAYTIECSITEDIKSTTACFQTALLYTSSNGSCF